jgi:hypothetical protein
MSASFRPRSTRPTPLTRKRQRTAAILWAERLAPAIAPALLILLAFITAAWTGLLAPLPPIADLALLIATIALAAALAARGLAVIARPTPQQIDRRLERNHPHRPLATIADRPALPGADPIWQAHRDRALALVPALQPGPPRLGAQGASAAGAAAVLILLCLLLGAGRGPARLWAALAPPHLLPAAAPLQLQAWIVPPEATGLGPIFLGKPDHDPIPVPIGARLTVSLIGSTSAPSLTYAGHPHRFTRLDHASYQASLQLTSPGALHVALGRHKLGEWRLAVAADQPPTIAITGPPRVQDARLRIPFAATDDYGLAGITAEIHLAGTQAAPPLLLKLPLPGLPRQVTGGQLPDLTANPWAGLPIRLHYIVRDGSNQIARSVEILTTLPERVFLNPIARALIAVRRNLVQDPSATKTATSALDRIAVTAFARLSPGEWLNLRAIAALLYERPQAAPETEARLWQLAVEIEDQGLNDAKQRLAQARDALRDALAAAAPPPPPPPKTPRPPPPNRRKSPRSPAPCSRPWTNTSSPCSARPPTPTRRPRSKPTAAPWTQNSSSKWPSKWPTPPKPAASTKPAGACSNSRPCSTAFAPVTASPTSSSNSRNPTRSSTNSCTTSRPCATTPASAPPTAPTNRPRTRTPSAAATPSPSRRYATASRISPAKSANRTAKSPTASPMPMAPCVTPNPPWPKARTPPPPPPPNAP